MLYDFYATTNPASTQITTSNNTLNASVTAVTFHKTSKQYASSGTVDRTAILQSIGIGSQIMISTTGSGSIASGEFVVTGYGSETSTQITFNVSSASSNSGTPSNNGDLVVDISVVPKAGDDGNKGQKGQKGATGATGPKGNTGATGPQGAKGQKGATGTAGAQGAPGSSGSSFTVLERGAATSITTWDDSGEFVTIFYANGGQTFLMKG